MLEKKRPWKQLCDERKRRLRQRGENKSLQRSNDMKANVYRPRSSRRNKKSEKNAWSKRPRWSGCGKGSSWYVIAFEGGEKEREKSRARLIIDLIPCIAGLLVSAKKNTIRRKEAQNLTNYHTKHA